MVAALNLMATTEHMPSPAAADNITSRTAARPTAAWDSTTLQRDNDTHAYAPYNIMVPPGLCNGGGE